MSVFFFYGTLMQGLRPAIPNIDFNNFVGIGPATIAGRLYAIETPDGCYPALVLDTDNDARVHGYCFRNDRLTPDDVAALDRYELYDPNNLAESEYRRIEASVHLDSGSNLVASLYAYNVALPDDARLIANGNFADFLRRTGQKPYSLGS